MTLGVGDGWGGGREGEPRGLLGGLAVFHLQSWARGMRVNSVRGRTSKPYNLGLFWMYLKRLFQKTRAPEAMEPHIH